MRCKGLNKLKYRFLFLVGLVASICFGMGEILSRRTDFIIIPAKPLFCLLLLTLAALIVILIFEYKKITIINLIIENKIFDIETAKAYEDTSGNIVYTVSCFGILLGSRIIKYNIDGIELTKVEISKNFIYFTYGKNAKFEKIKLLHNLENEESRMIADRIQYELGISPIINYFG